MSPRDDALEADAGEPLPWPGCTAQDFARKIAGELPAPVPATQRPPADMPPLPLMVLDALADDVETIYTMRNCGDMAPDGLAIVGETRILDALRTLLADGQVDVWQEHVVVSDQVFSRSLVGEPRTTDDDLRRYWFRMTVAGRRTWEAAEEQLEAYWDAHPLKPRTGSDATPST